MTNDREALWALLRTLNTTDGRLFACNCAEHILPIYHSCYPDDLRLLAALTTARAYARGTVTIDALQAAESAAEDAAWEAAVDDTLTNEAAPSVAAAVEACCAREVIDAITGALNGALEAVVIAAVGGDAANMMWTNQSQLLDPAVVAQYHSVEDAERAWHYQHAGRYRER
jgi:uncharacterized protein YfaA (DUF2138 family)